MIPRGAMLVDNSAGTAAGIHARFNPLRDMSMRLSDQEPPHRPGAMTDIFVMPGVPKEMKAMFERHVLPLVRERRRGRGDRLAHAAHLRARRKLGRRKARRADDARAKSVGRYDGHRRDRVAPRQ